MSNQDDLLRDIREAIVKFDADRLRKDVERAIESGISAHDVLMNGMAKGMETIGKMYEEGDCFLPQLLASGETMKVGLETLEPSLQSERTEVSGKVVIGTVQGDLHDLGKNILVTMLKGTGFEVHDLGVDVPATEFLKQIRETGANILAMSALLTTTCSQMSETIELLRKNNLRSGIRVIIGGIPTSEEFATQIGADAHGKDAFDGLRKIRGFMKDDVSK